MKNSVLVFVACLFIWMTSSCNYITYTPRSKRNIQREKPSILIFSRIVDFRIEQNSWPVSKEDFINKGKKYYEAFQGFKYSYTRFKIIDSNTMIFYFSNHIQDIQNYNETQKVDLNSYQGQAKFYKWNDRFVWKLKMH